MDTPSKRRWLRYARKHLTAMFPTLPGRSGYNKRLRVLAPAMAWLTRTLAPAMAWLTRTLAASTGVGDDSGWVADSTPVECSRSRETALRSELIGWVEYGYCASHSRFFWGLRLRLLTTVHGLLVGWTLSGAGEQYFEPLRQIIEPLRQIIEPLRQIIESVNDTFKEQLDLERHGDRTVAGVCARVTQRVLALTAAIWHNDSIGAQTRLSLLAYYR